MFGFLVMVGLVLGLVAGIFVGVKTGVIILGIIVFLVVFFGIGGFAMQVQSDINIATQHERDQQIIDELKKMNNEK